MRWRYFFLTTVYIGFFMISSLAVAGQLQPKLFTTDFNHPESGFTETYPWEVAGGELWYGGGDPDYDCDYNYFTHPVSPDFQYEIQAAWRGGDPEAGFGILFRIADNQGMLALEINRRGFYQLSYIFKKYALTLEKWRQSNAIKQDGFNKLKVICNSESVKCYLNDILVIDFPDDKDEYLDDKDYDKPVRVGVIASSDVKCAFDNLLLRELSVEEN